MYDAVRAFKITPGVVCLLTQGRDRKAPGRAVDFSHPSSDAYGTTCRRTYGPNKEVCVCRHTYYRVDPSMQPLWGVAAEALKSFYFIYLRPKNATNFHIKIHSSFHITVCILLSHPGVNIAAEARLPT